MSEKSLLGRLRERRIYLGKMISENRSFVSCYFGSSSVDGGHLNYSRTQIEVLLASVPDIFPYDWKEYGTKLTERQDAILKVINEIEPHPQYSLPLNKIPEIIHTARFHAEF